MAFHPELATGCLDAIEGLLTCDEVLPEEEPPGCAGVFEGLVEAGGVCRDSVECAHGYCAIASSDEECITGVCTAFKAAGAACQQDEECGDLDCVTVDGSDACGTAPAPDPNPTAGQACVVTDGDGSAYLRCDNSWCDDRGDRLCHPLIAVGAACSADNGQSCVAGAQCLGEVCRSVAVVGAGQPCGLLGDQVRYCSPLDGLTCDGVGGAPGVCVRVPTGQCVAGGHLALAGDGGCSQSEFCASPDEGMLGTCSPLRADGATCEYDLQCASAQCNDSHCGPC